MSIFQDSLFILRNSSELFNPSNLVLPILIIQIDGIMSEIIEHEGGTYIEKIMNGLIGIECGVGVGDMKRVYHPAAP